MKANAGAAYLTAAVRARPNLTVRSGVLVDRVAIEGGRATGVRLAGGEPVEASEVMVSAGVYGSPAVLLRSGVGPAAHLGGLGIPVRADLPVGERLQDRPMFVLAHQLRHDAPHEPEGGSGVVWTRSSLAQGDELDVQLSVSVQPDLDGRGVPVRTLRPGLQTSSRVCKRQEPVRVRHSAGTGR